MLVTREDFLKLDRNISESNYNKRTLDGHIRDAQFVDLQTLMGMDFYQDVVHNNVQNKYDFLINGGQYTYQGKTYFCEGLKAVIVYYAYARYILQGSNVDTPFGLVNKETPESSRTPYNEKKAIWKQNRQTAGIYWSNVTQYLNRNKNEFPLYFGRGSRVYQIQNIHGNSI
jgi:hypothetical protein